MQLESNVYCIKVAFGDDCLINTKYFSVKEISKIQSDVVSKSNTYLKVSFFV